MSSVIISGDTSGSITLAAPAVSGTNTITLPASTGTVMVSGNMPAFSARNSSTQSISNNTFTKITLDSEDYDTNNNFASSRFTPTVAGYYLFTAILGSTATVTVIQLIGALYKNGSNNAPFLFNINPSATYTSNTVGTFNGSSVIYLNGSTDYVELYIYSYNAGITLSTANNACVLTGNLLRTA